MSRKKARVVPGGGTDEKFVHKLDDKGREVLDTTPVTLPVRYQRGENITERVQKLVAETISRRMAEAGLESLEDANDFYVEGDDYFPSSEHEVDDDAERAYFERRDAARVTQAAKKTFGFGDRKDKRQAEPPPKSVQKSDQGDDGDKSEDS